MSQPVPESAAPLQSSSGTDRLQMINVAEKPVTARRAVASGRVRIAPALAQAIAARTLPKGDLLTAARLAGIQAAKRTAELIPLCHPLPLEHVDVAAWLEADCVRLRAEVRATAKTGVEMEALTAVALAALTVIDMGKAIDPAATIEEVRVIEKTGGVHGNVRLAPDAQPPGAAP